MGADAGVVDLNRSALVPPKLLEVTEGPVGVHRAVPYEEKERGFRTHIDLLTGEVLQFAAVARRRKEGLV